jgi:Flp pilus assembly protein TadG
MRAHSQAMRAQALVEFALAIGVFMLLVLGTFDLARAYLAYTVVTNSAREASRYAAAHPTDTAGAVQAGRNLAVGVDPAAMQLEVSTTAGPPTYVTVRGSYAFHSLTPLVRAILGDPITLQVQTAGLSG